MAVLSEEEIRVARTRRTYIVVYLGRDWSRGAIRKPKGEQYTISTEMTDKGYERTPEQCKIRMPTLKRFYQQCKSKMKKSGKGGNTCKYFEELDAILGT